MIQRPETKRWSPGGRVRRSLLDSTDLGGRTEAFRGPTPARVRHSVYFGTHPVHNCGWYGAALEREAVANSTNLS